MGLDMYLYAKKYIYEDSLSGVLNKDLKGIFPESHGFNSYHISKNIITWRKVNAVHNWFITKLNNGVNNCEEIYVSTGDLEILLSDINTVLTRNDLASNYLPTKDGFFFGNTEYNEQYFDDLKQTKEILENILKFDTRDLSFYYRASW